METQEQLHFLGYYYSCWGSMTWVYFVSRLGSQSLIVQITLGCYSFWLQNWWIYALCCKFSLPFNNIALHMRNLTWKKYTDSWQLTYKSWGKHSNTLNLKYIRQVLKFKTHWGHSSLVTWTISCLYKAWLHQICNSSF